MLRKSIGKKSPLMSTRLETLSNFQIVSQPFKAFLNIAPGEKKGAFT